MNRHLVRHVAVALLCSAIPLAHLNAQRVPQVTLKPANARLAAEFTRIISVRELADGRALVTDEKENRIVLVDFRNSSVSDLGRVGGGPGEFRKVAQLWPLPGDSTLMSDRGQQRWLLFHGPEIVATWSADVPMVSKQHSGTVDGAAGGNVLGIHWGVTATGQPSMRDSMRVLRIDRGNGQARLTAHVTPMAAGIGDVVEAETGNAALTRKVYSVGIVARDGAALFADGWIAVARYNPYRVDWCSPAGKCNLGPNLEPSRPMSDREKKAYLEIAARTHRLPPTNKLEETAGWPRVVPAFVPPREQLDGSALLALPDGRLMIERFPSAESMHRAYDIIDRAGRIAGRLILSLNERVISIGRNNIYVLVSDEFDVQRIRRHPWP